ncbi:MAG: class I adenylate-forming enzyme family protein [Terriglobales bacterium]|jgi:acyl-CoA synthetase (AMP-forming)/AMP-acid ligase II
MLSSIILEETIPLAQEAVVTRGRPATWEQLRAQAHDMTAAFAALRSRRVGVSFRAAGESYAALAALDKLESDTFLFDAHLPLEEMLALARKLKLGAVLAAPPGGQSSGFSVHELCGEEKWSGSGTVTILTSGSTGEPKAARHTWESLSRPVRKGPDGAAPRWLLTYRPNLYAGLQVMLQCFADRGTLAIPDADMDPRAMAQFMCDAGVQFVSATPSFWRRLLILVDSDLLKRAPLVQITLGGEVVDQPLLDRLKQYFPQVRLAHIYATTELGRCFSVHDGMAGFPASYLGKVLPDRSELRIQDGELLVRSANSMRMYDPHSGQQTLSTDWFATGDLVELKGNRVYFVGRRTDMINVAGSKVYPMEVERVIRVVPGVSDVRVFGKVSSVAGELVACEIVPAPGQDPEALKMRVNQVCRSALSSPQQPRLIKLVDQIGLSAAGKTLRSRTS